MRPYPFSNQEWHDRAAAIEHPVEIDIDHALPALDGKFMHRRSGACDTGGRDKNVDLSEHFRALLRRGCDRFRIGDIERDDMRGANIVFRVRKSLRVDIPQRHFSTFRDNAFRCFFPKARRATGDDRAASFEAAIVIVHCGPQCV